MPTTVPSARAPICTSCTWPRAWPMWSMFSVRDSTHSSGSPSRTASAAVTTCSTYAWPLAPKPPPVAGTTTCMRSGSSRRQSATVWRTENGLCVGTQSRRRPAPSKSGTARIPLVSIGAGAIFWFRYRNETTTSAPSSAPGSSIGSTSKTTSLAAMGSALPGNSSISTITSSARSRASARVSPTTTATGSPTYPTVPVASAGRPKCAGAGGPASMSGSCRSSAVKTPSPPEMPTIRPWGTSERTKTTLRAAMSRSSTYDRPPVSRAASSRRSTL